MDKLSKFSSRIKHEDNPKDIIKKLSKQIEDLKENKHSYYCVIPWKILTNKMIGSSAKLLYGEISALANKEGYCWASNSYLSKIIGIKSPTRISVLLRKLKEFIYISIEINKSEGNKRKIWTQHPIIQNNNRYCSKEEEGIVQKKKKDNIKKDNREYNNTNKQVVVKGEGFIISGKEFNDLIALFEPVNPSFERLFPNKGQRAALERMLAKHGYEKIKWILSRLPEISRSSYAPVVTTPCQLEQKLGQLIIFLGRETNKGGGVVDARQVK